MLSIIKVYTHPFAKNTKQLNIPEIEKDTIVVFKINFFKKNNGVTKVKINYNYLSNIGSA